MAPSASSKQRSRRQPSSTLQISALWNASLWDSLAPWNLSAEGAVILPLWIYDQAMTQKHSQSLLQSLLLRLMLQRACNNHLLGIGTCCRRHRGKLTCELQHSLLACLGGQEEAKSPVACVHAPIHKERFVAIGTLHFTRALGSLDISHQTWGSQACSRFHSEITL